MNLIQIAGHLGDDPVTRFTAKGQKVTTMNVATNLKKGETTVTIWYRVTIWGDRFDKMLTYLKKGSAIIVVGELQKPELWTDKEGRQQVRLEIWAEMLRFSPFGSGKGGERPAQEPASRGMTESFGEQTFQGGGFGGGAQQGHRQNENGMDIEEEEEKVPF